MGMNAKYESSSADDGRREPEGSSPGTDAVDFEHRPEEILSVLEPDQLFAAKQHAHLGLARLSTRTRALMWGLRVYVIAMLVIVLMQVLQSLHGGH
jgi:hypothetical protein